MVKTGAKGLDKKNESYMSFKSFISEAKEKCFQTTRSVEESHCKRLDKQKKSLMFIHQPMPTLGHQNGIRAILSGGTWSKKVMMSFKQFVDEDVRKMPDGTFGVFADKFKTVKN